MAPYTELSLFSGAGGGLLGTTHLLGWRTVCYVEWDKYAVDVLKVRIRDGYLHDAPIWDDAFTFDGRPWRGLVDVLTAGFPCQPFSVAGKGLAENDPRNGFPAVSRILREVRPRFALLENVPGLISKPYFATILGEISEAGYDVSWDCVSAQEIGANHKRERLWILAHASSIDGARRRSAGSDSSNTERPKANASQFLPSLSNASVTGLEGSEPARSTRTDGRTSELRGEVSNASSNLMGQYGSALAAASIGGGRNHNRGREEEDVRGEWWAVEPRLGRVADGVPNRVDRLRAIGNGQVPAVVEEAWNRLSGRK